MDSRLVGAVAAILSVVSAPVQAAPEDSGRPALTVRWYGTHEVSRDNIAVARVFVEQIFAHARIEVVWNECSAAHGTPADASHCAPPPGPAEVILRMGTAGPLNRRRYSSMGESLIGQPEHAPPCFATVFVDRVIGIAADARMDWRRLLGYAIAHELGHLLLNDPRHPANSLMRAVWSRRELRRNSAADWLFGADEAETMRAAILARHRGPY